MPVGGMRRHLQELKPNLGKSPLVESKPAGYRVGNVQFASSGVGTPVVDSYHLAAMIARIYDPYDGTQG